MESSLFESLGLEPDPGVLFTVMFVLILILLIVNFILIAKYSRIKTSYDVFMSGRDALSMEEAIMSLFDDITLLKAVSEKNKK